VKKSNLILCFFFWLPNILPAQNITASRKSALSKSDMVIWDPQRLATSKSKLTANDAWLIPAYKQLLKSANEAMLFKPVSVIDKKETPPSVDKHDYMSIAPYWWPDPMKPNGLPYIRKDGEVNPEVHSFLDKENLPRLCEHVHNLSLAYYLSGNEEYAIHASKLINVWFLDSATAMNPNLQFGQAIKGITTGRAEGLIEIRHFIFLVEAIALLKDSQSFEESKQKKLKKWMTDFFNWMQTSQIGRDEKEAINNHGVWYDATSLALAIFIGDTIQAKKIIHHAAMRLDSSMNEQGYFPLELARTTSLHYSVFILDAFTLIAHLSQKVGFDFWNLQTTNGKSLKKGYDALLPYLAGNTVWTWKQIKPFDQSNAFQMLWKSSFKYNCGACVEIIKKNAENYQDLQFILY